MGCNRMFLHVDDVKTKVELNVAKAKELRARENGVHDLETTQCSECGIKGFEVAVAKTIMADNSELFELTGCNVRQH